MRRSRFLIASAVALAALPIVAHAAEQDYPAGVSGGALSGTLALPATGSTWPVVLIIAGSGPTDRDGNSPPALMTDAYKLLAAALAARGIASVRYDKRGIGGSKALLPNETDARFEMFAADAAAYLKQLRADKRFSARGRRGPQ